MKQLTLPDFSKIQTANVFAYECSDSLSFTAYVRRDSAWLFLPDTTLKVLPVASGSGAKYQGRSYIYWSKGDEAILQHPQGPLKICSTVARDKAWAAAEIRNVDFRALGQEPGWILEITENKQLKYISRYGQDTVVTPVPKPQADGLRTVYEAKTEAHNLTIEIIEQQCRDAMSGFAFPAKVTLTIDGKSYQGCGKKL